MTCLISLAGILKLQMGEGNRGEYPIIAVCAGRTLNFALSEKAFRRHETSHWQKAKRPRSDGEFNL